MADLSVVIPCYNAARFIRATVGSVLDQTDPPKEVWVIDDGSTDDSPAIVQSLADAHPGVVHLIRQENAGESRARNVGIEASTGRFIAFLDADDLWLPTKTARQIKVLGQFPDAVGVHSRAFNFENDLDDRGREETETTKDDPSIEDLIHYHYLAPSSVMIRREVFIDHGVRFDEAVRHSEDMLFFADVRLVGSLRLVDEPLAAKRVHGGQQTKDIWHPIYSLKSRIDWVRQHRDRLGDDLADQLDTELSKRMVATLEDRYWRRQFTDFHRVRQIVEQTCPQSFQQSFLWNKRIYPRWVYQLRDRFAKH